MIQIGDTIQRNYLLGSPILIHSRVLGGYSDRQSCAGKCLGESRRGRWWEEDRDEP